MVSCRAGRSRSDRTAGARGGRNRAVL